MITCPECRGSGSKRKLTCTRCSGTGSVPYAPKKGERVKCLGCNDGVVRGKNGPRPCRACHGNGYIVAGT